MLKLLKVSSTGTSKVEIDNSNVHKDKNHKGN